MLKLNQLYERNPSVVSSNVGGGVILVPIRHQVGDLESIYTLSETASRIWALVDGQHSLAEIAETIAQEFEVGLGEAQQDVVSFIERLEAVNMVQKV